MKKRLGLAVILVTGAMTIDLENFAYAQPQPVSIKVFDATPSFATGPITSPAEATPFASALLFLDFNAGDTAVISSTPDGTGPVVIDNFLTINGVNACEGLASGENCFGEIIDPDTPTEVPIQTVLTPIPPIDVSALLPTGATTVLLELRDFGIIAGNTDLFLVTTADMVPTPPPLTATGDTFVNTPQQAVAITGGTIFVIDAQDLISIDPAGGTNVQSRGAGSCVCIPNRCCCGPIGEPCKWCPGPRACSQ